MKITGYIFLFVLPLLLMACNTAEIDTAEAAPDSRIQLSYAVSRSGDTGYESSIEGIDVIAFDENNVCAYHEHFDIQSNGEKLLLGEKKTFFTPYVSYHVYLIANGSAALQKELDAFKTEGKKLADLRGVVQTTENIYLTGSGLEDAPTTFLMDGVARLAGTEYGTVVLNDGSVDNVQLDAVLSRAAAKVVVTLTPDVGKGVSFPVPGEGIYYNYQLVNMRTDTRLLAEGGLATNPKLAGTGPTQTNLTAPAADRQRITFFTYTYSHSWENTSLAENITYLVVKVPITQTGSDNSVTSYVENYYKIPVVTSENAIARNTCYNISANIGAAGATDVSQVETLEGLNYQVLDWIPETIGVGDVTDKPKFLYVNKHELVLRNVADDESIVFASSSDITAQVTRAFYVDKDGVERQVSPDQYLLTAGGLNGALKFHSTVPLNNLIRFFTIQITNGEGLSETVQVAQYPLDYITYLQGYYSTREDLGGTTYENYGTAGVTVKGNFRSRVALPTGNGIKIYQYAWLNPSTVSTTADPNASLVDYRMYHIRITSTSNAYVLGVPQKDAKGYTAGGEDNANLVSPSFMINSQLGATQGANTSIEAAAQYCAQYQETYKGSDGKVYIYSDWRLPTRAEINIIIKYQGKPGALAESMYTVMTGSSYWSPTGLVANPNYPRGASSATRCVRDMYDDTLPQQ